MKLVRGVFVVATVAVLANVVAAQPVSLKSGAFTAAQQKRGAAIYNRECSTCHGETLKGGEGSPPLVGPAFTTTYAGQTVADLFTRIRETMPAPPEQPGKLTPQEYADVVAHILSANGFPAGGVELPSEIEPLKRLRIEVNQYFEQAAAPTFNRDVAPVFYRKCLSCHRPGEVAPMSLLTYDAARPWARAIRTQVASGAMPPWFADKTFSRPMANDNSLTASEITTIVQWVDAGAPEGEGRPPDAPAFSDGWRQVNNRPPDAVLEMESAVEIPASGVLPVLTVWSANPFKEDKFIEAVQLRPGAVAAVHHSDLTARALPPKTALGVPQLARDDVFRPRDDNRLLFYVPGGGFQRFPPGAVKRISAGNALAWGLHYTPTGKSETDRHRAALWFARTPHSHEVITKRIGEAHIINRREFVADERHRTFPPIPAYADDWPITAITPIQDDITIYGLWPHMHLRGKDMTFIATYPDGREEVLLHVPKYDFRWQLQYELVSPVRLPAGSTIKAIGHYDNSRANKNNPAPDKPVSWSEQTSDEMFNGWMELSIDKHVIAYNALYTVEAPKNERVSLSISSGPPGTVFVRNSDGSIVASGSIGSRPSFIEPWRYAPGQTVSTGAAGRDSGTVTLTMHDVPPDVSRETTVGGPAVAIAVTQPGQNGVVTFAGAALQRVGVQLFGNRIGSVRVRVMSADRMTEYAGASSSSSTFRSEERRVGKECRSRWSPYH